ncbi:MAG: transcriptional regulator [Micrococcales bacterium]|nr:MAG: transcriptional regulator [Micrococcales bacterium]
MPRHREPVGPSAPQHDSLVPDLEDLKGFADHTVAELGVYLREQRQNAQLSIRQLAELAGVSNPYLSQVERGLRKPSAGVLQQIAHGLQISAQALYVRAGILDATTSPATVDEAISADEHLTARQRKVLLDLYHTFRADAAAPAPAEETAMQSRAPRTKTNASEIEPGFTQRKTTTRRN